MFHYYLDRNDHKEDAQQILTMRNRSEEIQTPDLSLIKRLLLSLSYTPAASFMENLQTSNPFLTRCVTSTLITDRMNGQF